MDRHLYTAAAHARLDFANPIFGATIDRALAVLTLPDNARVIDIGCGKGELAVRIARRWGGRGTGVDAVDSSALMIEETKRRGAGAPVNAVLADAGTFVAAAADASYDGAACVGSSHALGGAVPALSAIARLLRPGGEAIIGEGVWESEPSPDYLKATGMTAGEMPTIPDWTTAAEAAGLMVRWLVTASTREWDEYEWAHARGIEDFAEKNPQHPDAPTMLARSRAWRSAYLAGGRGTLGFALMVCRRVKA